MNITAATAKARKMLQSGFLKEEGYSLKTLFEMRDALYVLDKWGYADLDLLREVEKYIAQKTGYGND